MKSTDLYMTFVIMLTDTIPDMARSARQHEVLFSLVPYEHNCAIQPRAVCTHTRNYTAVLLLVQLNHSEVKPD